MSDIDSINPLGPLSRRALRHHVVQSLLKAIIQGELAAGTHLVTNKLAVRLGVSATPIREALVELEQTGVVELLHHRGALVRPFGRKEVQDFYAVRRLLECEAVRLACPQIDPERLRSLRSDLERLLGNSNGGEKRTKELLAVDRRIHVYFLDCCSNKRLIAEIERYHALSEAMRDILGDSCVRHEPWAASLVDLLEAVEHRRKDVGAAAMGRHITFVATVMETGMFDGKDDPTGVHA